MSEPKSTKNARNTNARKFGVPKYVLIGKLYEIQGHTCPICKQSILTEMQMWIAWKTKQKWAGRKLRRKDVNLNIDHIEAVGNGGTNDMDNLALTHTRCNTLKDNITLAYDRPKRSDSKSNREG